MKLIFLFLSLMFSVTVFSQDVVIPLFGVMKDYDSNKKLSGVKVTVYAGSAKVDELTTPSNGKYGLALPLGKDYRVVYSKPGYVNKVVLIKGTGIDEELLPAGNQVPTPAIDLDLFSTRPNVDFGFLENQAVAEFDYKENEQQMYFNTGKAGQVKKKIEDLLAQAEKKGEEAEEKYQKLIADADKLYDVQNYEGAQAKYTESIQIKGKEMEPHPNTRIIEIDAILKKKKEEEVANAAANQAYDNLITAADNFKNAKDYEKAISKYEEASEMRPEEVYPKDQIDLLMKEKKKLERKAEFDALIKSADMFYGQNSMKAARDKYEAALKIDNTSQHAKDRMAAIDKAIKDQEDANNLKKKYDELVKAGDDLFNAQNWSDAKVKYQEAVKIESAATYPVERIKLIDEKIKEEEAAALKQEQITKLLAEGKTAFDAKSWDPAKTKYSEVLELDPANAEAQAKLLEIAAAKKAEEDNLAQKANFDNLIAEGDGFMSTNKYQEALDKYKAAQALMNVDPVQSKIDEAQTKLDELLDAEAAAKKKEEEYNALITAADNDFNLGQFQESIDKYKAAIAVKSDPYPESKIKEAETKLAELAKNNEKNAAYEKQIQAADQLLEQQKFEEAKVAYQEAVKLDDTQDYPKTKIDFIDSQLENLKNAAAKKAEYEKLVSEGDALKTAGDLSEARKKFVAAQAVDNQPTYPQEQIAAIDKELVEQASAAKKNEQITKLFAEGAANQLKKDFEAAVSNYEEILLLDNTNTEAQTKLDNARTEAAKLKGAAELEADYQKAKESGDDYLAQDNLEKAKQKYEAAKAIKDTPEVNAQLAIVEKKLAEKEAENAAKDAYDVAIDSADAAAGTNNYDAAIAKYKEALVAKPNDAYATTQIAAMETAKVENAGQAKIDEEYSKVIAEADAAMSSKNYEEAIKKYNAALAIKNTESYPSEQAAKAAELWKDETNGEDAAYQKIIDVANKKAAEKDYDKAIELFERAKSIKAGDPIPDQRITEIKAEIQAEKDALANQAKILADYSNKIKQAEVAATNKNYERAIELFEEAKVIKSDESTPDKRISEIQAIINSNANESALDASYREAIKKADAAFSLANYPTSISLYEAALLIKDEKYPKDQIELAKSKIKDANDANKEAQYLKFITSGNTKFKSQDYQEALSRYKDALAVKPGDKKAQDKIDETQQILDELANSNAEEQEKKRQFDALIKSADELFAQEEWMPAKKIYEQALKLYPLDGYAKKQIIECDTNEQNKSITQERALYDKIIAKADEYFADENYAKAKELYQRVQVNTFGNPYPKNQIDEIDRILAGPAVVDKGLENLGTIDNISLADGAALFQKADQLREQKKTNEVLDQLDQRTDNSIMRNDRENQEILGVDNEIFKINKLRAESAKTSDLGRQDIVEDVAKKEIELRDLSNQEDKYETGDIIREDQNITYTKRAVSEKNKIDYNIFYDNEKTVKDLSIKYSAVEREDIRENANQVQNDYQDIRAELEKVGSSAAKEQELRDVNTDLVKRTETAMKDIEFKDNTEEYNRLQAQMRDVEQAEKASNIDKNNGQRILDEIDNSVRREQLELAQKANKDEQGKAEFLRNLDASLADVRDENSAAYVKKDEERQQIVQDVKVSNENLSEYNTAKTLNKAEQIRQSEVDIDTQKEIISENVRDDKDEHEALQQRVRDSEAQLKTIDRTRLEIEAEDQNATTDKIDESKSELNKQHAEKIKNAEKNNVAVKTVTEDLSLKNNSENIEKNNERLKAQEYLDNLDVSPKKITPVIANSLGEDFPEGVTQENYIRKDKDDLPIKIITRRIVVNEGKGDVYLRIQTRESVTYTKNGAPSTVIVWQKETNDAKLVKHYSE